MVTVEISTKLTVDDLVSVADKLPNQALTEFVQRVVALQVQRGLPLITIDEEKALRQVVEAQKLPELDQARVAILREKSREGTLTADEHAELLHYVQRVERQDLTRLQALIELAQKRGTNLSEVMHDLGIEAEYA